MITLLPVLFVLGMAFVGSRGAKRVTAAAVAACAAIVFSGGVSHAQTGKNVYKDPSGAYSVIVPAGWEAQPQQGSPMVTIVNAKTKISVTTGVMKGPEANTPSAQSELEGIQKQFPQSCPQAKIDQQGKQTLAGIPGEYMVVHCVTQGGPETMKFIAATRPGTVALLIAASPGVAYLKELVPMMEISSSLKILGGTANAQGQRREMGRGQGSAPGSQPTAAGGLSGDQDPTVGQGMGVPAPMHASGQSAIQPGLQPVAAGSFPEPGGQDSGVYHDPRGRYSLAVPPGWTAKNDPASGTLQLASGQTWATVTTGSGATPADANSQITSQIQAQYKEFQILNQGDFQNNGHAAHGANATGINPKGVRVSVLVMTIAASGNNYLAIISSAPSDQAQQINGVIMQMVHSVRFGGE
jgi:hypothetical protein